MTMRPILEIKSISKKFRISSTREPYLSIRDQVRKWARFESSTKEDFWALQDISYDVMPGESIGIIGRNGAGKSTLLKILSRITPPTSGKVISRARIASLLEVGTGFHPELTGRENIFLNGSILGMKKAEITKQFDQIVDFAGTEQFLDTPLKHYSSGMQLRLAFAVAAFLEPEILIVDEVLAVGDAEFQRKCLGKMEDISSSGRTLLFVSHNMSAVTSMCKSVMVIEKGKQVFMGPSQQGTELYLNMGNSYDELGGRLEFVHQPNPHIRSIEFRCDGMLSSTLYMNCSFELSVHFVAPKPLEYPVLGVIIYDSLNTPVLYFNNKNYAGNLFEKPADEGTIVMRVPALPLMSGMYSLDVHFGNLFSDFEVKRNIIRFRVEPRPINEKGEMLLEKFNKFFIQNIEWGHK